MMSEDEVTLETVNLRWTFVVVFIYVLLKLLGNINNIIIVLSFNFKLIVKKNGSFEKKKCSFSLETWFVNYVLTKSRMAIFSIPIVLFTT